MSKTYTPREILRMALGTLDTDRAADLDADGDITPADARLAARGEGSAPKEPYEYGANRTLAGMRETLLDSLMGENAPSLRVDSEKLYDQYRELYARSAESAAKNAFGLAAAHTGGYGSSYAAAAAGAAYDRQMSLLPEKALEIDALALKSADAQRQALQNGLAAVNGLEQQEYDRYRDLMNLAFSAAKIGDYAPLEAQGIDTSALRRGDLEAAAALAAGYGDYSGLRALGVDTSAAQYEAMLKNAAALADYGDYSGLQALGVDTSAAQYGALLKNAAALADYGDYSGLQALGVDTSAAQYEALLKNAVTFAQYGDYSGLEALGADVSQLKNDALFERALALAGYGDYSLLAAFTSAPASLRQKVGVSVQKGAEEAYLYGGYSGLVRYLDRQVGYGQLNENAKTQIIRTVTGGRYAG